jgi:hypothetical protein
MKKLSLDVEDLAVETFAIERAAPVGTVVGLEVTPVDCSDETFYVSCRNSACPADCNTDGVWSDCCPSFSDVYTCLYTCDITCPNTCDATCPGTCHATCGC